LRADHRPTLFISDLHLAQEQPVTVDCFLRWLDDIAGSATALYILGDLFESWPGDDYQESPFARSISTPLHRLSQSGTRIFLIHGNRDFLLGSDFCASAGAELLPDPSQINLYGDPTLLLHGDTLCTDDLAYQQFRAQVRNPEWQQAILVRPLDERLALAKQLRERSESAKEEKSAEIMDVNAEAVSEAFRKTGCRRMIHGHTHRPARHIITVDGLPCERWVLPDWHGAAGGYLRCDQAGCELINF
jgi:UDP-2,3-diacylglucosamine hydrolase